MFKFKDFVYKEETHEGFYKGKKVPSITQLLETVYPLDINIPEANLLNAAARGTEIHAICEKINETYLASGSGNARKVAYESMNIDAINYYRFLSTYGLMPYDFEKLVFLFDEKGNLIAYGHFDIILKATATIEIGGKVIYEENEKVLHDIKTVSSFDEPKTKIQTELYRVAYEQCFGDKLSEKTGGIHLRDNKCKLYLFGDNRTNENMIKVAKVMRQIWNEKNGD